MWKVTLASNVSIVVETENSILLFSNETNYFINHCFTFNQQVRTWNLEPLMTQSLIIHAWHEITFSSFVSSCHGCGTSISFHCVCRAIWEIRPLIYDLTWFDCRWTVSFGLRFEIYGHFSPFAPTYQRLHPACQLRCFLLGVNHESPVSCQSKKTSVTLHNMYTTCYVATKELHRW